MPPAPVYKGCQGEGWPANYGGAGGVLLLPGVGLPPPPILFLIGLPSGKREREVAGHLGEARSPLWAAPFTFPLKPNKAHILPDEFP